MNEAECVFPFAFLFGQTACVCPLFISYLFLLSFFPSLVLSTIRQALVGLAPDDGTALGRVPRQDRALLGKREGAHASVWVHVVC